MNIKITYDWLLEYLDTDADPYELQKYLSLCGPGVERVEKVGDDYVLDIEVTTNRVDMASVFGIAQEAQAILPRFGKKAKLKKNPLTELHYSDVILEGAKRPIGSRGDAIVSFQHDKHLPLYLRITDSRLAPRIAAIILSNIKIGPSPEIIRKRLKMCDIRPINNVVDVTNYMRIAIGQPGHAFDYDSIKDGELIVKESKKGQKITTLDGKTITLPGGDIIIEDKNGVIIDLPGIMGGLNSEIKETTKNVLFFVPIFNKKMVRKTSMLTGQRSDSATYFEKGLDEERVEPALVFGIQMLQQYAAGKIASKIADEYSNKQKPKSITVNHKYITNRIGIDISVEESKTMLELLGFKVEFQRDPIATSRTDGLQDDLLSITVPFWRKNDIEIPEDIVEEIARIYGYHNLPNNLPPPVFVKQPKDVEKLFSYQSKMKYFLKHLGLHESMNYSMISDEMIAGMNIDPKHHLKLTNTNSEELQYMRISLLPSMIKNIKDNTGKRDELKFFEISKVYYPHQKNPDPDSCPPGYAATEGLPTEVWKLAVGTNTSFGDVKGIMEALMSELRIPPLRSLRFEGHANYELRKGKLDIFSKNMQVDFILDGKTIGTVGQLAPRLQEINGLKNPVFLAGFDLQSLIDHAKLLPQYKPVNQFGTVKLDLTIESPKHTYAEIVEAAKKTSAVLENIEYVGMYKNKLTLRFYFSAADRNLTDKEAVKELEKIKGKV